MLCPLGKLPPHNKDEWGRCDQEHGEPWRQHAKRRKPNRKVMGSVVLFIQKVRSRKVRLELAGAGRDGHGRWLLAASLGTLVFLGILTHARPVLYRPATAPVLGAPFQDNGHLD